MWFWYGISPAHLAEEPVIWFRKATVRYVLLLVLFLGEARETKYDIIFIYSAPQVIRLECIRDCCIWCCDWKMVWSECTTAQQLSHTSNNKVQYERENLRDFLQAKRCLWCQDRSKCSTSQPKIIQFTNQNVLQPYLLFWPPHSTHIYQSNLWYQSPALAW